MNALFWLCCVSCVVGAAGASKPHLLFFLVDDLGWANTELHDTSGEVKTPHAKALSQDGLMLMRHYAFQYCSPTRSSLMSGRLPYHVNQKNHPPSTPGGGVPASITMLPAKLKKAGYATHQIGKWHCGMSLTDLLPVNRGFDSSLGYLSGAEDYYTQKRDGYVDFWETSEPAHALAGTNYSAFMYRDEMLRVVKAHDASVPLFVYFAIQNVHTPLQAPEKYMSMYSHIENSDRRHAHAMATVADDVLGEAVTALKNKGMWDNLLLIYSSDNGGPLDHENNYPLRGGKTTFFEGGVRVAAFVSGGFLPQAQHGKSTDGMIHISDWYTTFCGLAGVPSEDHVEGIPDVDGVDVWSLVSGATNTSPRTEIMHGYTGDPLGAHGALTVGTMKLVVGYMHWGGWTGPSFPNNTGSQPGPHDCGSTGCLFDISADPNEHNDLASSQSQKAKEMLATYHSRGKSHYQSGNYGAQTSQGAIAQAKKNGGFWGPWPANQ